MGIVDMLQISLVTLPQTGFWANCRELMTKALWRSPSGGGAFVVFRGCAEHSVLDDTLQQYISRTVNVAIPHARSWAHCSGLGAMLLQGSVCVRGVLGWTAHLLLSDTSHQERQLSPRQDPWLIVADYIPRLLR